MNLVKRAGCRWQTASGRWQVGTSEDQQRSGEVAGSAIGEQRRMLLRWRVSGYGADVCIPAKSKVVEVRSSFEGLKVCRRARLTEASNADRLVATEVKLSGLAEAL